MTAEHLFWILDVGCGNTRSLLSAVLILKVGDTPQLKLLSINVRPEKKQLNQQLLRSSNYKIFVLTCLPFDLLSAILLTRNILILSRCVPNIPRSVFFLDRFVQEILPPPNLLRYFSIFLTSRS